MLDNGPVHPGEGVALEMGGLTIHRTHRVTTPFGLVLEDALFACIDPGDTGTPQPGAGGNGSKPPVR